MINAAIVGLGWWGKTLVESLSKPSEAMRFVAGTTRTMSPEVEAFAKQQNFTLVPSYEALLSDPKIDAVVLTTPPSGHLSQITAAAAAGKHVFCEKPFTYSKKDADTAVNAVRKAKVALGIGFNRRFHPEMTKLRERIKSGGLGTIEHIECTMTVPNGLFLKPSAWRAQLAEAPCGGLAPLGVHAIDGFIDFFGEIGHLYCQSFRRAVENETDDTTSVLFRMKNGASGYLGTMMATAPFYAIQVYGSAGWVRIEGMTHVAGASSEERRTGLFGNCKFQPVKGETETWQADRTDTTRVCLEDFARAASGGAPFMITPEQIIHGASVTETIIRSAGSGNVEKVA
jgi:predicted dehydrogenase